MTQSERDRIYRTAIEQLRAERDARVPLVIEKKAA